MKELQSGPWSIPASWVWTSMGHDTQVVGGGTPATGEPANWDGGNMPWITPADLSGYKEKFISRGARNITPHGLSGSGARLLPAGAVLFSSRAPIGYVAIARNPLATNQGFKSFVLPPGIHSDFVYYYLQRAKGLAVALASGTTFLEISGAKVAQIPLPVPPQKEQQRIVAEIEKHFTRLDAAVAALKRVQVQLKRYRASVLRVTQDSDSWTREGKDWQTATVATLAEAVVDCPHSTATFQPKGCACLDTNNIQPGRVVTERLRFVSQAVFIERIRRLRPRPGDVVFAREGTVGTAVRLPEVPLVCLGQRVMLIRPGSGTGSSFLQWALMAPQTKAQYRSKLLGSTVPHLNVADVKALRLAVPAVEEQHLIVEQVELHWSLADVIEAEVESAIRRSGLLRQSLLALAFAGRLVPQDPSDEPAAALLERIRAERQAADTTTRAKTRKPRNPSQTPSVEFS